MLAIPLGALFAIPLAHPYFYASNFRNRSIPSALHNLNYGHKNAGRHPNRLALRIGSLLLPLSAIALTASTASRSVHAAGPIVLAAIVAATGVMVITECHLLLMDNYDVSDIPDSQLSRNSSLENANAFGTENGRDHPPQPPSTIRTAHPCLASAFIIVHSFSFVFAAFAVGISAPIVDGIGIPRGFAVATAIMVLLTGALVGVLWRSRRRKDRDDEGIDETENDGAGVSLLMRSWGSRWWESVGRKLWVEGDGGV